MSSRPKTAAIVVAYNPPEGVFDRLVSGLSAQADAVVVVDNKSARRPEAAYSAWRSGSSNVVLLELPDNLGVGGAQNAGVEKAAALGAEFVFLFDHDSTLPEGYVDGMLSEMAAASAVDPTCKILGPTIIDERTGAPIPSLRSWNPRFGRFWVSPVPPSESPFKVEYVIASGSMFSVEAFRANGPLLADFFMDMIDIEWCWRAASKGLSTYMTSKVRLVHAIGEHTFKDRYYAHANPAQSYYFARNMVRAKLLNWRLAFPLGYCCFAVAGNTAANILSALPAAHRHIFSCARGLFDGLRGVGGKL